MGSRRVRIAFTAAVAFAVTLTSAAAGAPFRVLIGHSPNKTATNRTAKTISRIVIHDTQGRFIGSIRHLQNPRVDGSAHFVVSRRGQIVQLVPVRDVAWHSGNSWWNLHSIGIEHEGWVRRHAYTEAEYRASAELVAYLAHRWGIPLDRRHIIGHNEVPDPYHPGELGGFAHHTDPGPYWNWRHYMSLVRWYSGHRVLPHFVRRMRLISTPVPGRPVAPRSIVDKGATVRGRAVWWSGIDANARWRRRIYKVDFIVDGRILYTDNTWPYSFHREDGWDTRTVANGTHMLVVRAYGTRHYRVRKRVPVRVDNRPLQLRISGAADGAALSGDASIGVAVDSRVQGVTLYADGTAVSRDATAPYGLTWNTNGVPEGPHTLVVSARTRGGRRAEQRLDVIVANSSLYPSTFEPAWPGRAQSLDG